MPQQPNHFDIAVGLGFKPTARTHPVQIAVDIELQQIGRTVTGTTRRLGFDADKPRHLQIQTIDKGIDEPHRVVGADIIVHRFRQK